MNIKDITNHIFGKLRVLSFSGISKNRHSLWLCLCECGNKVTVLKPSLTSGATISCGCFRKLTHTKHGMYNMKEYTTWNDMMMRCYNKNNKKYKNYGARGITVCNEWHKFENFYKDMGDKPKGLTLDRIDNNGNYYKENCRWTDYFIQANNTSRNHFITCNGETKTIAQWSKITNIPYTTIISKICIRKLKPEDILINYE